MKKSIVYLSLALIAFCNVAEAANVSSSTVATTVYALPAPTPLCVAISKGDTETVKKFIEYGADVNQKSNGMTPLMMAARYNNVEVIKLLLSKGAKVKETSENGFTALKYAEISNAKEAAEFLKGLS